ncbi:phosphoribosylamine--glycine ligase [Mesosutterella sp. AGMB02718]|uniref:Phosphoribosylamine--glycine ligase n=1 Tax=Mesosutterella faecium TaxID=2925194 RepID=A0ABT7IM39_9BURK|nr:phosphoribosylamine--glycine ligase [Mesosutterella sp. AGMB02718]MDL2059055.1 phosphoribosylamine--glycine ligase [Mesosutterella sp. AGMB02718]
MKVLVVGSGGREHALAWRIAQSDRVQTVYVAPGNAGTDADPLLTNVAVKATDLEALAAFARDNGVDYTVVGPEAPLAAGIVDLFRSKGLQIFGPTKAAAQLESSKDFAKAFMKRHGIPTAAYETFTDLQAAESYIRRHGAPIVVKADGLAAGKGVVVAATVEEALHAVRDMLSGNKFGAAGSRVVIEDFLEGEEASFIVASDGQHVLPMATSQDHKRLLDHDQGPNTGGMGAYSPAPVVTPEIHDIVMREVILPTVAGMASEGHPFTGFLYAGLMIGRKADGTPSVRVLEFNCRMGDPETQPIMSRIRSDLSLVFEAAIGGRLDQARIDWDARSALGVVCAAAGYPEHPRKGDVIESLPRVDSDHLVFHAGTAWNDKHQMVVNGGRVLCVVGLGDTLRKARDKAYEAVAQTRWNGMQCRSDIGWRALK